MSAWAFCCYGGEKNQMMLRKIRWVNGVKHDKKAVVEKDIIRAVIAVKKKKSWGLYSGLTYCGQMGNIKISDK